MIEEKKKLLQYVEVLLEDAETRRKTKGATNSYSNEKYPVRIEIRHYLRGEPCHLLFTLEDGTSIEEIIDSHEEMCLIDSFEKKHRKIQWEYFLKRQGLNRQNLLNEITNFLLSRKDI